MKILKNTLTDKIRIKVLLILYLKVQSVMAAEMDEVITMTSLFVHS